MDGFGTWEHIMTILAWQNSGAERCVLRSLPIWPLSCSHEAPGQSAIASLSRGSSVCATPAEALDYLSFHCKLRWFTTQTQVFLYRNPGTADLCFDCVLPKVEPPAQLMKAFEARG